VKNLEKKLWFMTQIEDKKTGQREGIQGKFLTCHLVRAVLLFIMIFFTGFFAAVEVLR